MIYTKEYFKDNPQVSVGDYTYGVPEIRGNFQPGDMLTIGKFCSIATDVKIFVDNGLHSTKNISTFPFLDAEFGFVPTTDLPKKEHRITCIKNDVWICEGARIFSGVTIGNGAVIGAGAHVREDVPDYSIVIGNPAKVIKYRFTYTQIEKLLKLEWWNKELDWLTALNPSVLNSTEIDYLLDKYLND